jgi:ABC-2 type transport system ATP-binding protein
VLGLDPWRDGTALKPRLGVMLQDGGLYPGIKAGEVLRQYAGFFRDSESPEALLDLVGLSDVASSHVRRLSGGQRQRLALALALVGRPEVVFLDEPTAGMDPHARTRTWDIVRNLAERGATVLLTTHFMDEAERLCDRVAIVDRGRLVALGAPGDLGARVAAGETRFSARSGLDRAALAAALGLAPAAVTEDEPGEYAIAAEATPVLVADLACWLRDRDEPIGALQAGRRSLEEVFLKLTNDGTVT